MEAVTITEASHLLEISRQRILQLIYAQRVKGAYKTQRGWKIPLYGKTQMPKIIRGKRGRKGTWLVRPSLKSTVIHVNKGLIASNNKREVKEPVIIVRKGSKTTYCSEVSFNGQCKIVYRPDNETLHAKAKVWIEVDSDTKIAMKSETMVIKTQVNKDINVSM
ncbi:hypothetical protein [Crocosphaera sp.]|uniref:hypothetical protein n=1 Tax=Crocosphaera sp. TaxID=2729996 RepID=UPI003F268CB8|nr:hypothetical protein [Crocosphaera sp.]